MTPLTFPILKDLGLNETEALIYELLLQHGTVEARELVIPSGLGRGNVYNALSSLEKRGLILSIQGEGKTRYQPADPSALRALLELQKNHFASLSATFEKTLPALASKFTLSSGKPAIQLFEGIDGCEHVLEDSLTTQGEILTIIDPDAMSPDLLALEERYIRKRVALHIYKRVLMPNTEMARAWVHKSEQAYTQTRLCPVLQGGFCAAQEIYDASVSLITLRNGHMISVLMRDPSLNALQRAQFEGLWQLSA